MKWFFDGSLYINIALSLAAFILACTWKEKKGKALLAWAMLFYLLYPVFFKVRLLLIIDKLIENNSVAAQALAIAGGVANMAAHVLILCFVIVAGSSVPAPAAQVLSQQAGVQEAETKGPLYYFVPVGRLVLLSIISAGIYAIYWIYRNWRYLKERDALSISPFWRGFFGVFYMHKLLRAIHGDQQVRTLQPAAFSPGWLATGWVILVVIGNIVSRIPEPAVAFPFLLLSQLSFLFLIPVQNYINGVNHMLSPKPQFHPWTGGDAICLIIGLVFWPLVFIGLKAA